MRFETELDAPTAEALGEVHRTRGIVVRRASPGNLMCRTASGARSEFRRFALSLGVSPSSARLGPA